MKGGQAVEGGARVLGPPPLEYSHCSHALGQIWGVRGKATPPEPCACYAALFDLGLPDALGWTESSEVTSLFMLSHAWSLWGVGDGVWSAERARYSALCCSEADK